MKQPAEQHEITQWPSSSVLLTIGNKQEISASVYKRLTFFFAATNALLLSGQLMAQSFNWVDFLILQWTGITGVLIVYRFNDLIDHSRDFSFNLQTVLSNRINIFILLQLFFLLLPIAIRELSPARITALIIICILGVLYSVKFKIKEKQYRLKHLFLVKNILIGVLWGALIPVGADNFSDPQVLALFLFTSLQVFIGSIVRDIPDTLQDRKDGVQTLPVVFGFQPTMSLLHLFNSIAIISASFCFPESSFILLMLIVVFWRIILLVLIEIQPARKFYTNTLNLLTCLVILGALIFKLYTYGS